MLNPRRKWMVYAALTAAESLAALLWLLAIPGEASSAVLLGLSPLRLLLAAVPLVLMLAALAGVIFLRARGGLPARLERTRRHRALPLIFLWLAALGVGLLISGPYSLGWTAATALRLQPVLILFSVLFLQTAFSLRPAPAVEGGRGGGEFWAAFGLTALMIAAAAGVGAWTGITSVLQSRFYSGAGAPVLPLQTVYALFAALSMLLLSLALGRGPRRQAALSVLAGLLLFALAVGMWLGVEIPDTHFTRPSNLPGEVFVPYSDARIYDANAQQMLLGYGLAGGNPLPRPLYSFFLGLLHGLTGQSTRGVINAQTVVLALLPVGIFLLGRRMGHAAVGFLAGLLVIFRETNQALLSAVYTLSSARMLMSELFTAGFLVLLLILGVRWLAQPDLRTRAALTGIALGLTALIRTQALLLLAVLLVFAAAALWRRRRALVRVSAWLLLGLLLVVLPWMGRNALLSGAFVFEDPSYAARTLSAVDESGESSGMLQGVLADPGGFARQTAANFTNSALSSLYQLPWNGDWEKSALEYSAEGLDIPFYPYRTLSQAQRIWLAAHLLLIALGLAGAWRAAGWSGLLPLGIYLGYNLSAAAAGFSGWRFIQPVDWIALLYWSAGVVVGLCGVLRLLRSGGVWAHAAAPRRESREWSPAALIALALAAGLLLPVGERLIPRGPVEPPRAELLDRLKEASAGQDIQGILELAEDARTEVFSGTLLYPMLLRSELDFARTKLQETPLWEARPLLYFDVVGERRTYVYLPVESPAGFARHGQRVVVIGCRVGSRVEAAALLVEGQTPRWLLSSRPAPSVCPAGD